jgi:hypothetical protein
LKALAIPFLLLASSACGRLVGLEGLEYRDDPGASGGAAGAGGQLGAVCDPASVSVSAENPVQIKSEPSPPPEVGAVGQDPDFGTPRVRVTDETDGASCEPAPPEPLSPNARRLAYTCEVGARVELRVVDLSADFTPTLRQVVADLPGGEAPAAAAIWDGDDALFVHDSRQLTRLDLAQMSHAVLADFTASLSGADLDGMAASADREQFAFIARSSSGASYFLWRRSSGDRTTLPHDDAQQLAFDASGRFLVVHASGNTIRIHDLETPNQLATEVGPAEFTPDESRGLISGDRFVNGITNNAPSGVPTILSRTLDNPAVVESLIDFQPGSDGLVHLGSSPALPGWVAVSRFNGSSSPLNGELFLLSHQKTMRRVGRHAWAAGSVRPTPYLSENGCAVTHPSNWGGTLAGNADSHVFLLDLRTK